MNPAAGQRWLVIGLGVTGASLVRYLSACGAHVRALDTRAEPPAAAALKREFPSLELLLGAAPYSLPANLDALAISPGIALDHPLPAAARQRGIPVLGDIELFALALQRRGEARVAAITGSNGKSTVTSMLGEIAAAADLRVAVGGNLGQPALDLLGQGAQLFVLELSSFQLESTRSLQTATAVVLNVSADHIDRHASIEQYAAIKARIYARCQSPVVNLDDSRVSAMTGGAPAIGFTLSEPAHGQYGLRRAADGDLLMRGSETLMPAAALHLAGRHNIANALAAWALAQALGIAREPARRALSAFSGLPHRCQWVAVAGGVNWYDDSKATNVGATTAAVEGFEGCLVLLAGGQAKGGDFRPLAPALARKARAAVLFGEDADLIAAHIGGVVPVYRAADLTAAVALASQHAEAGDSVLLSPACASFDMFRDYIDRGEQFARLARGQRSCSA